MRISTVPTALQRQGVFSEPVAGGVPAIYDPATTAALAGGGFSRRPFANNTIPAARIDPVALGLLQRYPRPNLGGTANNYQRIGLEHQSQEQFSLRLDHRFTPGTRGLLRGVSATDRVLPVTPLPDGSGSIAQGAIGDTRTRAAHVVGTLQTAVGPGLNELRLGYTRRAVARTAGLLDQPLGIPGLPSPARRSRPRYRPSPSRACSSSARRSARTATRGPT